MYFITRKYQQDQLGQRLSKLTNREFITQLTRPATARSGKVVNEKVTTTEHENDNRKYKLLFPPGGCWQTLVAILENFVCKK